MYNAEQHSASNFVTNPIAATAAATFSSHLHSHPSHHTSTMNAEPRMITQYSPYAPRRGERRNYLASTTYPTSVPRRTQISPGVWSDGKDTVLSGAYPPVQRLLEKARSTLALYEEGNEVIFTLAALEVFYNPGDPAHWIFWSDEKKHQTAEVVTRIALHQPPLIRSNVAWNGANEYLSILANHHGSTWRHVYESQPWYEKLVPHKSSNAPKVINLRKRKTNPGAFREPSKSPGPEDDEPIDEPARKKTKSKPTSTPEPPLHTRKTTSDAAESSNINKKIKSTSTSTSETSSHENPLPTSRKGDHDATPPEEAPQPRMSTRNRKVISSQNASDSSRASSVSPQDSSSSSSQQSRNRSTSHTSSQTAVTSGGGRRSTSVLSANTAVDSQASTKGKQSAHDLVSQDGKEGSDANTDNEEGMVTRGRATRTRMVENSKIGEVEGDRLKNGKQASQVIPRGGAQKAKRKP